MKFHAASFVFLVVSFACSNPKTETTASADATSTPIAVAEPKILLSEEERARLTEELFYYCRYEASLTDTSEYIQSEVLEVFDERFSYGASYSRPRDITGDDSYALVYVEDDIDSLYITGSFKIIAINKSVEGATEVQVLIQPNGKNIIETFDIGHGEYDENGKWQITQEENQQETGYGMSESTLAFNMKAPRIYGRSNLFLKARICLLNDSDLDGIRAEELSYLRNEIFARHGHAFKTAKMVEYFTRQSWYRVWVPDANLYLNDFEKKNIEFIRSKEQG